MQNYVVFHLHSDLSSATTNIDSVTKYKQYIDKAKELGMSAMAFSEHGNIHEWYHKKLDMEAAGLKYIHACECYITATIAEKIKDNYHCVLIAKNYEGVMELNSLISRAYNREDGHFYYVPRISFDELTQTSNNIIISSACLGGILHKNKDSLREQFLDFMATHNDRCFLEIQHHNVEDQKVYNQELVKYSHRYNIPLIAGTDTHALNKEHQEARLMLQKSKKILFADESDWDLTFKSYDELIEAFEAQNAVDKSDYMEAINNTNVMADMIEEFTMDTGMKYPKIYNNSEEEFHKQINAAYKANKELKARYPKEVIKARVEEEFDTYKKVGAIDFMLMQTYLRNWEHDNGIYCGYSRGSVSGSMIAYILGVTQMDSIKFNLNFFRFMSPARVTNADIDTDYSNADREKVKTFILRDHMNLPSIKAAEIITFNTIQMKGAIKDIGRALEMPLDECQQISNSVIDNTISDEMRKKYPELFKYVDLVTGVIVSVGTHPSGVLISDLDISQTIGLCTLSTTKYPVTMLNMKELDALMYVKLDILGLDNIGVINKTCELAGIPRLTPDNTDLNDEKVWKSIRDDTTMIFQWESQSAQAYLKKFMSDETLAVARERVPNFSMIKWMSFGNGLIRPACASFRNTVADGIFYDNGLKELNDFLAPEAGRIAMQETIMQFLVKFCGYSNAESDNVRRAIAKKKGTETLLPEIEKRFIDYTSSHYSVSKEKCVEVIKPFIQVILDASAYAFSWNHSDAYSCIGYICGYLRYYYPLEFLTAALNIFEEDKEKTNSIIAYAQEHNIKVEGIKFRYSKPEYVFDKNTNSIYKGMSSIKYLNKRIAAELYALKNNQYNNFIEILNDLQQKTSVDTRQLDILIKLDFFSEFGHPNMLLEQAQIFNQLNGRKTIRISELPELGLTKELLEQFDGQATEKMIKNCDITKLIKYLALNKKYTETTIVDKINYENECLGYISILLPGIDASYTYVMEVNQKYQNRMVKLYRLNTGEIEVYKVKAKSFEMNPFEAGEIIKTIDLSNERKWRKIDDKWTQIDETEPILTKWSRVEC